MRTLFSDSLFMHVSGNGDGSIQGSIFDSTALTGHLYRLTFDDTSNQFKTYSVFDLHTDSLVVQNAAELDGFTEGPAFDGMRLIIFDYIKAIVNQLNTCWITGNTNLVHTVSLPEIDIGGTLYYGYPYPADYKITLYDYFVDTSSTYLGVPAIPIKFTVKNLTENHAVDIIFNEIDFNNTISAYDEIYILENDNFGNPYLTWLIFFGGNPPFNNPQPGDEFLLSTLKPFSSVDVFKFSTNYSVLSIRNPNSIIKELKLFQNYPNPFNAGTITEYNIPKTGRVELSVYNILGQKVKILLDRVLEEGLYRYEWNSANISNLASGIYYCRLKTNQQQLIRKIIYLK